MLASLAFASPLLASSPTGPGVGEPIRPEVPSSIGLAVWRSMPAGALPFPIGPPFGRSSVQLAPEVPLSRLEPYRGLSDRRPGFAQNALLLGHKHIGLERQIDTVPDQQFLS